MVILMPKIVVLDGYTLNPGDLGWEPLQELGDCTIYDRSAPEEVIERAADAEILFVNKVPVDAARMDRLPRLKYIGVLATGYNVIDVAAARERNITVTNIPSYGTNAVAQMTFALLLELTNRAGEYAESVRRGDWSRSPDFCYYLGPAMELAGRTFGVVGYGRIGRAAAAIARAFGMKTIASSSTRQSGTADDGTPFVTLADLLRESDVVSLHCPLTADNYHLINEERLGMMKKSAFLLNTGRGQLIDAVALAAALRNGVIAGAGLDVLEVEPPRENPLIGTPNCVITPHVAWATREARQRLLEIAASNLAAFLRGEPVNVVS